MRQSNSFCIFCANQQHSNVTAAHLFPQCIGGRVSFNYCCKDCNDALGSGIESTIKESLFFAIALDKLNLITKQKAYEKIQIVDTQTGKRLKYVGDRLYGHTSRDTAGIKMGPTEELQKQFKKYVRRRFPNWENYVSNKLREVNCEIHLPGETYTFVETRDLIRAEFSSQKAFPWKLLAKIAYEAIVIAGFHTIELLKSFFTESFNITKTESGRVTIDVLEKFNKRWRFLHFNPFKNNIDLNSLKYRNFHRIDYCISTKNVGYVRICFFGVLICIVIIGKLKPDDLPDKTILNDAFFFPIDQACIVPAPFPIEYANQKEESDILANIIWGLYSGTLAIPNQS